MKAKQPDPATEQDIRLYLKKHTEFLVKDMGIEAAGALTGKSKATLGRYYSRNTEYGDRLMPLTSVAILEQVSSFPYVTEAIREFRGHGGDERRIRLNELNKLGLPHQIIDLSQQFAKLMAAANAINDHNAPTAREAQETLSEVMALQRILVDLKLYLGAVGD